MDRDNLDDLEVELPQEYGGLPVFAVGGVVRDTIRGVEPNDVDLMVCETDEFEMKDRGFKEIDSSNNETFGVFQDSLGREVALAREEVSTGDGHRDFNVEPVASSVEAGEAVQRDLGRRDITVNAMALDARHNVLHDPHGGVRDLEEGVIRAVDETAFRQDPLRILRAARFAARLGFEIDENTRGSMWASVERLQDLPQERVRMEMEKALVQSDTPSRFFDILDEVAALDYTFPELYDLMDVPAGPEEYHKEGTAYDHTMLVLNEMKGIRPNDEIALLMALAHDLGKGITDSEDLPSHPGHEKEGLDVVDRMQDRLSLSNEQADAMRDASRYHMMFGNISDLRCSTIVEMVQKVGHPERLTDLAKADAAGRRPRGEVDVAAIGERLSAAQQANLSWMGQDLIEDGYNPEEMGGDNFGNLLRQKRVEKMRELEARKS